MTQRVLVLHGIWNANAWVAPLARRLRASGFEPEIFGYASIFGGPGHAVPRLAARLARGDCAGIVGHSLGGLIALDALRQSPPAVAPRVVCLGSPLRGSRTARALGGWRAPLLGRSAGLLREGFEHWDGEARIGMVAGNIPRGLGRLFASFEGDYDGTVAVEETRLPGLADHCVVASSHSGLVFSEDAARQAAHFLRHGRFDTDGRAAAIG